MRANHDPMRSVVDALTARLPPGRVVRDAPFGSITTYGVGGSARARVEVDNAAELELLAQIVAGTAPRIVVFGRGSNLLVSDEGFDGLVVVLKKGFSGIEILGNRVLVGGAAKMPVVARATVQADLAGFEWAVGVPGSVGGAIRMNAGGHGAEIANVIVAARVVDLGTGASGWRDQSELGLGYRHSTLGPCELVTDAEFFLRSGDSATGASLLAEIVQWRRDNQPGGHNAGSVFTNPPGDTAGRLIDTAGLKGLRIGTAEVSTKHANFIRVDSGGKAADVWAVMNEVKRTVHEVHGVSLASETHLIGFGEEPGPNAVA